MRNDLGAELRTRILLYAYAVGERIGRAVRRVASGDAASPLAGRKLGLVIDNGKAQRSAKSFARRRKRAERGSSA